MIYEISALFLYNDENDRFLGLNPVGVGFSFKSLIKHSFYIIKTRRVPVITKIGGLKLFSCYQERFYF